MLVEPALDQMTFEKKEEKRRKKEKKRQKKRREKHTPNNSAKKKKEPASALPWCNYYCNTAAASCCCPGWFSINFAPGTQSTIIQSSCSKIASCSCPHPHECFHDHDSCHCHATGLWCVTHGLLYLKLAVPPASSSYSLLWVVVWCQWCDVWSST